VTEENQYLLEEIRKLDSEKSALSEEVSTLGKKLLKAKKDVRRGSVQVRKFHKYQSTLSEELLSCDEEGTEANKRALSQF
jgi:uncharacterized protein (DUF3084 family)